MTSTLRTETSLFDLEREIDAWSEKAYGSPCRDKAATLDELKDHLHCEIERLETEGRTREEAFWIATAKLGESTRSASGSRDGRALNRGRIAHAIIWAAVMIATAIVLAKSDARESSTYLLIVVLIPAWYMSDLLLSRFLRASGDH